MIFKGTLSRMEDVVRDVVSKLFVTHPVQACNLVVNHQEARAMEDNPEKFRHIPQDIWTMASGSGVLWICTLLWNRLTLGEKIFLLGHEGGHPAFFHEYRGLAIPNVDWQLWNVSTDLWLNSLLHVGLGMPLPTTIQLLHDPAICWDSTTPEKIYFSKLKERKERQEKQQNDQQQQGQTGEGTPQSAPSAPSQTTETGQGNEAPTSWFDKPALKEGETVEQKMEEARLMKTAMSRMAGDDPSGFARTVPEVNAKPRDWTRLFINTLCTSSEVTRTFARPEPSYTANKSPFIIPSYTKPRKQVWAVSLDVSGSVDDEILGKFMSVVQQMANQMHPTIHLSWFNRKLLGYQKWSAEEGLTEKVDGAWKRIGRALPKTLSGGGGTNLYVPFDWMEDNQIGANVLVIFTDLKGNFPQKWDKSSVLWMVPSKFCQKFSWGKPKYGRIIQI